MKLPFPQLITPLLLVSLSFTSAFGEFAFEDDGVSLTFLEQGQPVLTYNYGRIDPPEGIGVEYWRSNYFHPVHGMDGEVLSQDFPADHPHHRGIFWTWPTVLIGDRTADAWHLRGVRQLFMDWGEKEISSDRATVSFRNGWRFEEKWDPLVIEDVEVTLHASSENHRAIDFQIRLENVSSSDVSFGGSGTSGYGGFNFRPDGSRPGTTITTATGRLEKDALTVDSPWADFSSIVSEEGHIAGAAIFQHPDNPDFPHSGWILRHYGFLGQAWPHYSRHTLAPGDAVTLRYRVLIHRDDAESANVAAHFAQFAAENQ